ncbi:MAG: phosphate ABC transporter permease, partial [Candidatus Omnitrophota bacterium]|nr:phosphate ABC transporter permease [Candidatus Omnitrophota bacterium]
MDKRKLEENIFKALMMLSTLIVVGSLVLILVTIFLKGYHALNLDMITKTPRGGYYLGKEGGILNAILGSLILGILATSLAALVSLPLAFYLNIYLKKNSKLALTVRFFLDVLWGIPSIVYGAFGFTLMIFFGLRASLLAGTITIALLIIPIMARSMDEVLKMIPFELK